jgi:hypothetical protein
MRWSVEFFTTVFGVVHGSDGGGVYRLMTLPLVAVVALEPWTVEGAVEAFMVAVVRVCRCDGEAKVAVCIFGWIAGVALNSGGGECRCSDSIEAVGYRYT